MKDKQKTKSQIVYLLIAISFIISVMFIYQYKKRKTYKLRFDELINNNTNNNSNIETDNNFGVSEEIIKNILEKLDKFENGNLYLNSNLTQIELSKKINTNSKYLSKVINHYKQKNFTNYINDLRISTAVEKLKIDSNFRKYTLLAIANEVGFKKTETFNKAFHKKTGLKPSFFIKQMME